MSPGRTLKKKPIGRPPAGESGEKVKEYPQLSVRLPRKVRDQLVALGELRRQPQWRLIVEAVECYLRDLDADERRQLDQLVKEQR